MRVVPAFQGLYAPWWDSTARGAIIGLTLHSTGAHVVRATLEALAFQTRAVLEAAEADAGLDIPELRVDGGATANPVLLQALADALGRPVTRALDPEATVRGAAFAAGLAAGLWPSPDVSPALRGPVETGAAGVERRPARDGVRRLAPRRRARPRLGLSRGARQRSRAIRSAWVSRRTHRAVLAVACEHDRQPQRAVVVVRHREAVGARDRHGEQVADGRSGSRASSTSRSPDSQWRPTRSQRRRPGPSGRAAWATSKRCPNSATSRLSAMPPSTATKSRPVRLCVTTR